MLEVILKQDIFRLGERGDVVRVADGYARNYLYPKRLAIPADKGSLKHLEAMRAAAAREAVRVRGDAEKQLAAIEGSVVRVVSRASLNNQLYGSVTSRDVAAKLADKGIEVDRRRIQMTSPVRSVGDYEVPIHIYKDLSTTVKLEVRAQGREEAPLDRTAEMAAQLEFAPAPPPPEEPVEEGTEFESAEAAGEDEVAGQDDVVREVAAESEEQAGTAVAAPAPDGEPVAE